MPSSPSAPPADSLRFLRGLIWLYLALWVIEGALRKWIVPSLSNPLLIVRDPVLLLIYAVALQKKIFPWRGFVYFITGLGIVTFLVSWAATKTPLFVLLYGARADFLHLPLIFLLPAVFDLNDVRAVGKWVLLAAPPMALLVAMQFRSPPGAWVNTGAGGAGTMIGAAYGHIRPSGTFSFTNGLSGFTLLVTAFFLHHLLEKRVFPRLLWLAAAPSLLVLVMLSGSRSGLGSVALEVAVVVGICLVHTRYLQSSVKLAACGVAVAVLLGSFAVFQQGMQVFAARFGSQEEVQSGFVDRFFSSFTPPKEMLEDVTLAGAGLGMGTNAGAGIITGDRGFLLAEGEYPRVIMEVGPILGPAFLGLRWAIAIYLAVMAVRSLYARADTLPALLFGAGINDLLIGQFAQPAALGYAVIAAALGLAANRRAAVPVGVAAVPRHLSAPPAAVAGRKAPLPAVVRGRSVFAEKLHAAPARETSASPGPQT